MEGEIKDFDRKKYQDLLEIIKVKYQKYEKKDKYKELVLAVKDVIKTTNTNGIQLLKMIFL